MTILSSGACVCTLSHRVADSPWPWSMIQAPIKCSLCATEAVPHRLLAVAVTTWQRKDENVKWKREKNEISSSLRRVTGLRHLAKNPEGNNMRCIWKWHTEGQIFQLFLKIIRSLPRCLKELYFFEACAPSLCYLRSNERQWEEEKKRGLMAPSRTNPTWRSRTYGWRSLHERLHSLACVRALTCTHRDAEIVNMSRLNSSRVKQIA